MKKKTWKHVCYGLRRNGTMGVIDKKHPPLFIVTYDKKKMTEEINRDLWKRRTHHEKTKSNERS